ncbi:MAG: CRISPR-associated endonuclease Cas1 [Patescibacteria group bacterium]|nr:MAG: CRISPR-associated endonuclease Cas1 [Chitinophagales bacterium]GIW60986.1 MAG: CRISPR-associated endonuclease Cas1 [Patescibacteria group bacterium]GIW70432.1 MAG: CRISPR-associated endonuclease Cas1 [Patescibacteria group bacterium]
MLKRTLVISSPHHLSVRNKQLMLDNKDTGEQNQAPIEDLGCLLLDQQGITLTQAAISELTLHNVSVIFCDEKHLPVSMLLPLEGHYLPNQRLRQQLDAGEPLRKQLWQQTVKAKLRNQAALLDSIGKSGEPLRRWATRVRSGDTTNVEGLAARYYWRNLFGEAFKRDRYGEPPNQLLNYGYAILRAAAARSLVASGLLPTLGIHHHNKYNAFCLADDIMEPFRPFVDRVVWERIRQGAAGDITREDKTALLEVLNTDVWWGKERSLLATALGTVSAHLAACFEGTRQSLKYPEMKVMKENGQVLRR